MRDSLDFVVRSSVGYDIESFDPQLYQILRSYVLSGDGARDSDVTIPFPDGDVLKSMLQKKKGSQLQAFPLLVPQAGTELHPSQPEQVGVGKRFHDDVERHLPLTHHY